MKEAADSPTDGSASEETGIGAPIADAFGRFWAAIESGGAPRADAAGSPTRAASMRDVRAAVTRLVDTQMDLLRTVVDAGIGMLLQVSDQTASTPAGAAAIHLSVGPGAASTVELWLHNQTAGALSGPFAAGPLVSGHGHLIPPDAVAFAPLGVRRLEPGGSAATTVSMGPLPEQAVGRYYGFVFVLGHADAVAQLVVDVVDHDRAAPGGSGARP